MTERQKRVMCILIRSALITAGEPAEAMAPIDRDDLELLWTELWDFNNEMSDGRR